MPAPLWTERDDLGLVRRVVEQETPAHVRATITTASRPFMVGVAYFSFAAWAQGYIARYEVAADLAIVAGLVGMALCAPSFWQQQRPTTPPS